ncbi:MAG: hypothetical protein KBG15_15405, partial [Kofleriaceae bacterium]|nr:hypothetical protein [Kofleriaceae bacterium]
MSTFQNFSRAVDAATPQRSRAMPRAVRLLAFAMAASAAMQGSYIAPAHAVASGITESAAPLLGSTPAASAAMADGDSSVSGQTGAFNYSYPIVTPPGRQGMAPKLGLSYSSQGAIYGTFAAGWNLTIPDIHEDTSQGRLATHHGVVESTQADPKADDRFTSSMAGGRPFVKVTEPADASVYGTYRARSDSSYTRYQRMIPSAAFRWRALTTDGSSHEFGGASASACASVISEGYAPLTRSLDQWNNSITYNYAWDTDTGECRIDTITYGANAAASRPDFARVKVEYNPVNFCSGSTSAPIGAHTDWRSGTKIVTGARSVMRLLVESRPGGLGNAAVHTRTVTFNYDLPGYNTGFCNQGSTPYRALQSIQETVTGTGLTAVTLPPVTFDYGSALINRTSSTGIGGSYGYGVHKNNQRAGMTAMWLDFDGDGRLDWLESWPTLNASQQVLKCGVRWRSGATNVLATFELPTIPWLNGVGAVTDCALNYQRSLIGDAGSAETYLNYRWLDMNGDGRMDVVATLETMKTNLQGNDAAFWPDRTAATQTLLGM